jgi:NTE family protein
MSGRAQLPNPIGVALAGGAAQGAIYEIGALRALDEALEGFDLNEAGVFVGVSAGGFLCACLANGLSTDQMCRAIVKDEPGEHPFVPEIFFQPAVGEVGRRLARIPWLLGKAVGRYLTRREKRLRDALTGFGTALPVGLFNNDSVRDYVEKIFDRPGRSNDFRELRQRVAIVVTDIESGEAVIFGNPGWDHVPISKAVQATTALPGLYPPVEIEGRHYVDGILRRTMHASVALKAGAELVFCINPVVPVDTRPAIRNQELEEGHLVRQGLTAVLSQTVRTLIHSRMRLGLRTYDDRFPDASVILLEPRSDDHEVFFSNIFSFNSRQRVCERAYVETWRDLRNRRDELAPLLAKHGITLNDDFLDGDEPDLWKSVGAPELSSVVGSEVSTPEAVVSATDDLSLDNAVLSDLDGLLGRLEKVVEKRRVAMDTGAHA